MARKKIPENFEKVKHSIIKSAIEILVKKSLTDFSLTEVAESVGVTKAAIYWYFPNKNALVEEIAKSVYESYIGNARQIMKSELSSYEKLKKLIIGNTENIENILMCLFPIKFFLDFFSEDNNVKTMIKEGYEEYNEILCNILSEGIACGEFKTDYSCGDLAKVITGAIDGLAFQNLLISSEKVAVSRAVILSIFESILRPKQN